jgi:hypothetical protein
MANNFIVSGNLGVGTISPVATTQITRNSATTSGVAPYLQVDQVADTGQTASTESPTVLFRFDQATRTWATGSLAKQQYFKINQPTIAFATASVVTDVATVGIVGAPVLGTNATGENAHGLLINTANVGASATNSYGLSVFAQSGATNNYAAQFMSGFVGIGTNTPSVQLDVYDTGETVVLVETPTTLSNAILRAWSSFDGTAAQTGDAVLQLGNKKNTDTTPDNCWYIGLDGSKGQFTPQLAIGFSRGAWGVPGSSDFVSVTSTGLVGIGVNPPTAVLQLKAGTATASTAPLKFTSGTNLTAPEAGTMEWNGNTLFMTNSTPTRQIALTVTTAGITGQVLTGVTGTYATFQNLNTSMFPAGTILQVLSVIKTDVFSSNSTSWTDWTSMAVTIVPRSAASRFYISVSSEVSNDTINSFQYVKIVRVLSVSASTDLIGAPPSSGVTTQCTMDGAWGFAGSPANQTNFSTTAKPLTAVYVDSPGTTSTISYKLQVIRTNAGTAFFGRTASVLDINRSSIPSTLIVMEVAG